MEKTGVQAGGVKHSLRILLNGLIDYAGLFPPAGLGMAETVANYTRYRQSEYAWALGRLIVPAARLSEFDQYFAPGPPCWHLSALIGQNPAEDVARVVEFNATHRYAAVVDVIESKANTPDDIHELRRLVPESVLVYFEVPVSNDCKPLIQAVASSHARAKIRTGGLTPEMFPTADQILEFLRGCIETNTAFKATAGLHHPLRCLKPLTYEKDSPTGTMHGFLNVFLAAAFLLDGLSEDRLIELLNDDHFDNFSFNEDSVTWKGHRLSHSRLLETRTLAASFGSCSFEEPLEDLASLRLL